MEFHGNEQEPRPGLRSGRIPNAINIPFGTLLNNGMMRSQLELEQISQGCTMEGKKLIFSCGSGVITCIAAFGATLAGYTQVSVHDGSWFEWGAASGLPVVTN